MPMTTEPPVAQVRPSAAATPFSAATALNRDLAIMATQSPVATLLLRDGAIARANSAFARLSGYTLEALPGMTVARLFDLADKDTSQALAHAAGGEAELPLRGSDGGVRPVRVSVSAREEGAADTAQVCTVMELHEPPLDIDHERRAELGIAQAQASLQRIIDWAPLAIGLYDARTLRLLQLNQMASSFIGRSVSEVIGVGLDEMFDPAMADLVGRDMHQALRSDAVTRREYRRVVEGKLRIWDARYAPLSPQDGAAPEQLLLVASDVTEQRAAEQDRLDAALAQRDMLVNEVHHRIKNNLQGVAGLMQHMAQQRPEVAAALNEAIGHVHAIAQVHGLQVGASGPVPVRGVLEAIAGSVQRMFGRAIAVDVDGAASSQWAFAEAESIPVALIVNELLTNAVKHGAEEGLRCVLRSHANEVVIEVINEGQLPPGFDLAHVAPGVSGIGLVRSLLPRRHASLSLVNTGAKVCASVRLHPPVVVRGESDAVSREGPA